MRMDEHAQKVRRIADLDRELDLVERQQEQCEATIEVETREISEKEEEILSLEREVGRMLERELGRIP